MTEKIDFVIPWVDGSDPRWLEEKNKYSMKKIDNTNAANRYRDMGILKYWFRSVEMFAPWVNKIHFVTWGHVPEWLNTENPKLNIVKHEDFIPAKYLPTFSANPIELNFHRIKGLAEKFVYFNDDFFLNKPVPPTYFFKNGLPCDVWRENIYCLNENSDNTFAHILLNDKHLICRNFSKKEVIKKHFTKCFNPKYGRKNLGFLLLAKWPYMADFDEYHTASPFLKSTFEKVWEKEYYCLDKVCHNKFRSVSDVNQYVMALWQVFSGQFTPRSYKDYGKYFNLQDNNSELIECIKKSSYSIICINDASMDIDFETAITELQDVFQKKYPNKSSFEK